MNKMYEVARLLGVELGQYFMVNTHDYDGILCITERGILNIDVKAQFINDDQDILIDLLAGNLSITHVATWTKIKEGYHG